VTGTEHGECITDDTLTEYLEGTLDPAIKVASEVHLLSCDDCRNRLGFFMRVLDQEVQPDETKQIQLITANWNPNAAGTKVPRRARLSRWLFGLAGIAAALVIGFVSYHLFFHGEDFKTAGEVVQVLLDQQRPFESRMSNESYLHIERTRGVSKPPVAYELLAGEMTRLSADAHEMGRFYLLQKDFGRAIQYLEMAAAEVGAPAAVHNDLGVAYLESGAADIEQSGREFRRALDLDPAFAPAVFNLALFYERTNAVGTAVAEWRHYLELDSKSEWGAEARARLQELSR
jgi:tetratricopeptide (TPR) repeat protein